MARIKSQPSTSLPATNHGLVIEILAALREQETPDGPVVFEVAQGESAYIQVVVIWERWAELSADLRNQIVLDAYQKQYDENPEEVSADYVSLILPVTARQAVEMNILPYSVQCNIHRSQDDYPALQVLLRKEGAIETSAGTELRLPTLDMARAARDRLQTATGDWATEVHWHIAEQAGNIYDYN